MSLKKIIARDKLRKKLKNQAIIVDEEPLIYSFKYSLNMRKLPVHHFKKKQWTGVLRSLADASYYTTTPMVLFVTFYVSPPEDEVISQSALKREKTPAVMSYELCDYLLSFMEMLYKVLIASYRQIVKVDMEKFYSDKPRTEFRLIRYKIYKSKDSNAKDKDTDNTEGESEPEVNNRQEIQPQRKGHEDYQDHCKRRTRQRV